MLRKIKKPEHINCLIINKLRGKNIETGKNGLCGWLSIRKLQKNGNFVNYILSRNKFYN